MVSFNLLSSVAGGPTTPLVPLVLAPIPRTGPLGDGSPITLNDTQLTLNWLDKLTSTLNLTEAEQGVYKALSSDEENFIQMLSSIRETVETSTKDENETKVSAGDFTNYLYFLKQG